MGRLNDWEGRGRDRAGCDKAAMRMVVGADVGFLSFIARNGFRPRFRKVLQDSDVKFEWRWDRSGMGERRHPVKFHEMQ